MTASAGSVRDLMCGKLRRRGILILLPALVIAWMFKLGDAGVFVAGYGVWWLSSYGFAIKLAKNIRPQNPREMWGGIIKAEMMKLLFSSLALAGLGLLFWNQALFLFAGYGLAQITLIGR